MFRKTDKHRCRGDAEFKRQKKKSFNLMFNYYYQNVFNGGSLSIWKTKWQVQAVCGSPRVFSPTYLPPGLMTMALLLRVSSSTWAMLSLAFWYESSVAQTVILSWMPPKQSSWTLPSLAGCREGKAEWGTAQRQGETVSRLHGNNVARMATDKNTLKRRNVFSGYFYWAVCFPRHKQLPHDLPFFPSHVPHFVGGLGRK